jgi:ketosteroid isomerase-like protein
VEIVKRATDAFHRRDIAAFAEFMASDFEWVSVFAACVEDDVYRGA